MTDDLGVLAERMDAASVEVRTATDTERRRTGRRRASQEMFDAMTRAEQDAEFGPAVAEAVRTGRVRLEDLVTSSSMATEPDFITQATAADLGLDTETDK